MQISENVTIIEATYHHYANNSNMQQCVDIIYLLQIIVTGL